MQALISKLKIATCQKLPGLPVQMLMAPPVRTPLQAPPADARIGAVAIVLYSKNEKPHLLLMRRTVDYGVHSGQISLPGGRQDATDYSAAYTAQRELQEEMGVNLNSIRLIGNLTPLYIPPSNFIVTPVVCYATEALSFFKSDAEVKEIIELPLETFLDPSIKQTETVLRSDDATKTMEAPLYKINDYTNIWGATAMMLRELEELILHR
jgi:8-oxo-dGTP pyrophosphatase MutT (NUDIX family)